MSNIQDKVIFGVTSLLVLALISGGILLGINLIKNKPQEISISEGIAPEYTFKVNISGAVASPGTYPAAADDTLISLVYSAGLKPEADTDYINIYVPDSNINTEAQKINVNHAEAWLLEALPEIGSSKAESIVVYRQQNGPFRSFDDLLGVDGISKTLLDRIMPLITLED